jgi:hypothetical protein
MPAAARGHSMNHRRDQSVTAVRPSRSGNTWLGCPFATATDISGRDSSGSLWLDSKVPAATTTNGKNHRGPVTRSRAPGRYAQRRARLGAKPSVVEFAVSASRDGTGLRAGHVQSHGMDWPRRRWGRRCRRVDLPVQQDLRGQPGRRSGTSAPGWAWVSRLPVGILDFSAAHAAAGTGGRDQGRHGQCRRTAEDLAVGRDRDRAGRSACSATSRLPGGARVTAADSVKARSKRPSCHYKVPDRSMERIARRFSVFRCLPHTAAVRVLGAGMACPWFRRHWAHDASCQAAETAPPVRQPAAGMKGVRPARPGHAHAQRGPQATAAGRSPPAAVGATPRVGSRRNGLQAGHATHQTVGHDAYHPSSSTWPVPQGRRSCLRRGGSAGQRTAARPARPPAGEG